MNNKLIKYYEVNNIIQLLLREVKKVLKDQFIGMYIHGSLATGDFNLDNSDIDFLIVTKDTVSRDLFIALEKIHNCIERTGNKWANRLEGSYVSKKILTSEGPPYIPRRILMEVNFL